jgi:hypothetical protein
MAALTLIEAAKLAANNGEYKRAGVITIYARTSAWLAQIPFQTIQGNAFAYTQESTLPGIAFRGVNEGYVASHGIVNPASESLRIAGGDLDVDRFIVDTQGASVRTTHEAMKVKALAHAVTAKLIKGNSSPGDGGDQREFDGLQRRIPLSSAQFVSAGTTDAGDPLSLFKLDQLIAKVAGPNKRLWMPQALALRFGQAARNTAVSGYVMWDKNELGQRILRYNGIPIDVAFPEQDGDEPLAFDEQGDLLGTPGGSTSASIYCVSLGEGYLSGIQSGPMQVRDLGELDTLPVLRTRVEWHPGLVVQHPRAIARYGGISDAPFTA